MAIGWFICSYRRRLPAALPTRYCAMDDFTAQIRTDLGHWSETEILGDRAIVKVRAAITTLQTIAGTVGIRQLSLSLLNDPISSLSPAQRVALRGEALDAGYSAAEVNARFPDISIATLGEVLRFMASRRLKPRYDAATDTIVLDGVEQPCHSVDQIDAEVV
jgi:hypothetical protein